MALVFPRLARNFIKNGYFPTDELTLSRIVPALDVDGGNVQVLDPCCGEGTALAEIQRHLNDCGAVTRSFGIEYDQERAWHAKSLLGSVAHSDVNDVFVTARSMGLLFLNPPYGDLVADKAQTGEQKTGRERLEKSFFRRTTSWLQLGGVLVLIIPHYVLDAEFAGLIARQFKRVQVFMAPEQQFKQAVIFGIKQHAASPSPAIQELLEKVGKGELPPTLPEFWHGDSYCVPTMREMAFSFTAIRIDAPQLQQELNRMSHATLWPQFGSHFSMTRQAHRRPLRDLSDWHLALALAAGQISGVVTSSDGRRLLIKGDTFKDRDVKVTYEARDDGSISEVRVMTDKFVPSITALDFTPGQTFGQVISIR